MNAAGTLSEATAIEGKHETFIKLPSHAIQHGKLVLKLHGNTIELNSYGGQDRQNNPIFTRTHYTELKDALKDLAAWRAARRKLRDA